MPEIQHLGILKTISHYLSLIKFSHTVFAMPFALIGFFLGLKELNGTHSFSFNDRDLWIRLLMVVLCMIFARSAAMAFNRYLDEAIDKLNPRTATREIPAGVISKSNALLFTIGNCVLFVVATWFINPLCFYLSPVALLVILFYSYTKRITALCHLILGVGLALAPIGAYLALTGSFDLLPLLFSGIVISWVSGFDILYALQDESFDREHNLKSIPVMLGRKGAMQLSNLLHLICGIMVIIIGVVYLSSAWYWTGAVLFNGFLIYQHTLVKPDDISKVNLAFATTNGIGSIVYALFVIITLIL